MTYCKKTKPKNHSDKGLRENTYISTYNYVTLPLGSLFSSWFPDLELHSQTGKHWHPPLHPPAAACHQSPGQQAGNNGGDDVSQWNPVTRARHVIVCMHVKVLSVSRWCLKYAQHSCLTHSKYWERKMLEEAWKTYRCSTCTLVFECAQKGMFEVINMILSVSRKITSGHQFEEEDGPKD